MYLYACMCVDVPIYHLRFTTNNTLLSQTNSFPLISFRNKTKRTLMEICMHNDFVYFHTKLVGVVHRFSRRASNINNNKTEHNHRKKNPNERAYMPIAHLKTDNRSILWWLIWDKESTMAILSCCLLWNLMTFQWKEAAEKIHPSIYIVYIAFLLHFYNMMYLCVCACVQEDNEKHVLEQHKYNALHQ